MTEVLQQTGIVFNIQRYTVHDGPGIRTAVFVKGCPLRCRWCDNPESFLPHQEVGVFGNRCVGIDYCGYCIRACPLGADPFSISQGVVAGLDRELCDGCMACVEACPSNTLMVWGEPMTVEAVVEQVKKDNSFYQNTPRGGGVTVTGGEPLAQWEFTVALLQACKAERIHTCVESALHGPWERVAAVLEYTDFVLTDIKHSDPEKHREYTGVDNQQILENLRRMSALGKPYIVRIPVVPGHNDDLQNIKETGEIIQGFAAPPVQVQLLPFHEYGTVKYRSLDLEYPLADYCWPSREQQRDQLVYLRDVLQSMGLPAVCGSSSKY